MSAAFDLLRARALLLHHARPSVDYTREHGIDWASAEAACGGIYMVPLTPAEPDTFDIDPDGPEAAIVEVWDERGATIDLCAWRPSAPQRWRSFLGAAPALGMAQAANPNLHDEGEPLRLHSTPLRWLQARCAGAALLDLDRGTRWLFELAPTAIAAEDPGHAAALHAARVRILNSTEILLPVGPPATSEAA